MGISGNLYNRLLEGIEDGIVHALTRKPISFDGDVPLEIHPPEDSSSYSKHDRMFYWLSDFINGNFQVFLSNRNYSQLSDDDAMMLCQIFKNVNERKIQELIDEHQVFDVLEPQNMDEIGEACRKFPDLSWTSLIRRQINGEDNPLWFNLTWFDDKGNEYPIWEYDDSDEVVCIRFSNNVLEKIDPSTGTDNSIIIPIDWNELISPNNLKWQLGSEKLNDMYFVDYSSFDPKIRVTEAEKDIRGFYNSVKAVDVAFNDDNIYWKYKDNPRNPYVSSIYDYLSAIGYCLTIPVRTYGNNVYHFYLPSIGQLRIMGNHNEVINRALTMVGASPFNINRGLWWSSTEFSDKRAWNLERGKIKSFFKTREYYKAFPILAINPENREHLHGW